MSVKGCWGPMKGAPARYAPIAPFPLLLLNGIGEVSFTSSIQPRKPLLTGWRWVLVPNDDDRVEGQFDMLPHPALRATAHRVECTYQLLTMNRATDMMHCPHTAL